MNTPTESLTPTLDEPTAVPEPSYWAKILSSLRYLLKRLLAKDLMKVASSLTYTTILALVPLLTVVLALFTAFPLFNQFQGALEEFLTRSLMPANVSDSIMMYLNQFAAKASSLTAIGSLFLIVTSIMLIMTIDQTFNDIWQVHQQRPLTQRLLVYWAIISLGPILFGASLWASSVLASSSLGYINALSGPVNLLLTYLPFIFSLIGFTALFLFVPNRKVWWRDALKGGLFTAVALEIMRAGFAFYLTRFPTYTIIYGAFATLPIFLLWIYISWMIVLLGASIAAVLPELRHRHWMDRDVPGMAFADAVNLLYTLWLRQRAGQTGLCLLDLSYALERDADELTAVLEQLKQMGLVANTEQDKAESWVLCGDLRQVHINQVLDVFLLNRSLNDAGPVKYLIDYLTNALEDGVTNLEALFSQPERLTAGQTQAVQEDNKANTLPST